MKNTNILFGLLAVILTTACNTDDEFINPFLNDDAFASQAAFVRFEETPKVLSDAEIPFDQVSNFSVDAELVDPAGNVTSYDLRVALNPGSALPKDVESYSPLISITNFQEDVAVPLNFNINDVTSALSISRDDLEVGDVIDFEAIATRRDGAVFNFNNLTGDMFNQGFRQAISFEITLTNSSPVATYFTLVPDEEGEVELEGSTFAREEVDVLPLAEGSTLTVYAEFDKPLRTLPIFSVLTEEGGSFGTVEPVTFTEDEDEISAVRAVFTAGSLAEGEVAFSVRDAVETDAEGGETMVTDTLVLEVDNVAPVYSLSYSAPVASVGFSVTITADFGEEIQASPTISISGQGVASVDAADMELISPTRATYVFTPSGGILTEGPLTVTVNASDKAGNMVVANAENPVLEVLD